MFVFLSLEEKFNVNPTEVGRFQYILIELLTLHFIKPRETWMNGWGDGVKAALLISLL